jgi:hypothetical protein
MVHDVPEMNNILGLQDDHTAAWSLFLGTSNTFGFWMDVLSSMFVAALTLVFFLLEGKWTYP